MQPDQRRSLVLERVRVMSHHVTWQRLIYKIQQKILIRHQPAYQATQQALLNQCMKTYQKMYLCERRFPLPSVLSWPFRMQKKKASCTQCLLQTQPSPSLSAPSRCFCSCITSPSPQFDVAPRQIKGYIFVGLADALCCVNSSSLLSLFFTH